MTDNYNPDLLNAVISYLDSCSYTYDTSRYKNGIITLNWRFSHTTAIERAGIWIEVLSEVIAVSTKPEIPVGTGNISGQVDPGDTDRMADAMLFLTAANYGNTICHFQLDSIDGEIRCVSSLYCGKFVPPSELIDGVFDASVNGWELYGDEFMKMLNDRKDPLAAVADAEH